MHWVSPGSYWSKTFDRTSPAYPPLVGERHVDVAVIGGGITGLTAALYLKQAGKQVAVVESGVIGAGTTGGTTGHLDVMPDQGMTELIRDFGEGAAREITNIRRAAIARIERWCEEFGIDCDFHRVPAYYYTEHEQHARQVESEQEAARKVGVEPVLLHEIGLPFPIATATRIDRQARFHSLRYLEGLARQVHGENATIYEQTRAEPPQDGSPCRVKTPGGQLLATDVILATHSAYLGISQFDMRQAPYQSYAIALRVHDQVPDALYWDDEQPYHYIRLASSDDPHLLIIGGADHKTGQADGRQQFDRLAEYAAKRFRIQSVEQRWSAEFFEPADGVPFIGRVPRTEHLYLGTGYSGTGLTYGTAAGMLLTDLLLGRASPDIEVFSPSRLKLWAAAPELISENLDVARRYIADRFGADKLDSLEQLTPGEGRRADFEGAPCALYREDSGPIHVLSAMCPHAGCHVQWNSAEKTWDCPCHGSRFSATGERLYGPSPADLERKKTVIPVQVD